MKTFAIILCFMIITPLSLLSQSNNRYFLHSVVDTTNNKSLKPVINHWISYLYETNDSLRKSYWDKEEVTKYKENFCLFDQNLFQFPKNDFLNYFVPYILSIEKRNDKYCIKTMFCQRNTSISDTSSSNQNPVAIIKVIVEQKGKQLYLKNVITEESKYYKHIKFGNLQYIVDPDLEIKSTECKKAMKFRDSLSKLWYGHKSNNDIIYYVTESPEALGRLLGFDFAFFGYSSGLTFIDANLLLSGTGDFNYRHELAHLILGDIPNHFFSEGLASYFGGSGNQSYNQLLKDFSKSNYPLTKDKIDIILQYTNNQNYYVLAAMLVEEVYNKKGIESLKNLSNSSIQDGLVISKICKYLNVKYEDLIEKLNNKLKN